MKDTDVLIIGGGISGLSAAARLKQLGIQVGFNVIPRQLT